MRPLYYDDAYLKTFEAKVIGVKDDKFITLDNTAFYPNSGGQPYDTGVMKLKNGEEFKVVFVGKFSGNISHEVDRAGLKVGDEVVCEIDWDRRYKLMRSHTAAHVLSYVFNKEAGALITGNQLDLDKCRMDFNIDNFDKELINSYVEKTNELLKSDAPVSVSYLSREEAEKDPSMFKLAKSLPDDWREIRVVSIGDFDRQADGGTHVKNTSEVGAIEVVSMKNKGSGNRRLYFRLVN